MPSPPREAMSRWRGEVLSFESTIESSLTRRTRLFPGPRLNFACPNVTARTATPFALNTGLSWTRPEQGSTGAGQASFTNAFPRLTSATRLAFARAGRTVTGRLVCVAEPAKLVAVTWQV